LAFNFPVPYGGRTYNAKTQRRKENKELGLIWCDQVGLTACCSSDPVILSEFQSRQHCRLAMGTPHRRTFSGKLRTFERGGAVAMRAARLVPKKHMELPGIIMEINDLRKVRPRPRSNKTGPLANFEPRRLPLTPYPKFQRASAEALLTWT
jgi:hypothetical protein